MQIESRRCRNINFFEVINTRTTLQHYNYSHGAFLLVLKSQFLQGSSNLTESIEKGYRKKLKRTRAIATTKIYLEAQKLSG